jgi:hypothetical protein
MTLGEPPTNLFKDAPCCPTKRSKVELHAKVSVQTLYKRSLSSLQNNLFKRPLGKRSLYKVSGQDLYESMRWIPKIGIPPVIINFFKGFSMN